LATLLAACLAGATGCCCSSSLYDVKAYETWAKLEKGLHSAPTPIEESTGVTIQLPILFDPKSTNILNQRGRFEPGKTEPNVEGFATEGLHPPMVKLPGLRFTYEMFYPDAKGKKWPVYCYLSVLPPGETEANKAKDEIKAAVSEKYPQANWQPVTLEGSKFTTSYLPIGGTQSFFPENANAAEEAPGKFELYLVSTPHANVLVGFRSQQSVAEALSMDRAAKASIASIKSEKPKQPAPPAGSGSGTTGAATGTGGTTTGGAASPTGAQLPKVETTHLREVGLAYHAYLQANNNSAPTALHHLHDKLAASPAASEHLKAGRIVFLYGVPLSAMRSGTSNTVLGYEKDTPTKGGLALYADGSVRPLTAQQFAAAVKAKP
jgi:hypothetical protein